MNRIFKKAINLKHLRFATGDDVLERWGYKITSASLEKPLLTTLITMTASVIILALFFVLLAVFAGVICLICIILLIEGFFLVVILAIFGLLITICVYIYVAGVGVSVYLKEK